MWHIEVCESPRHTKPLCTGPFLFNSQEAILTSEFSFIRPKFTHGVPGPIWWGRTASSENTPFSSLQLLEITIPTLACSPCNSTQYGSSGIIAHQVKAPQYLLLRPILSTNGMAQNQHRLLSSCLPGQKAGHFLVLQSQGSHQHSYEQRRHVFHMTGFNKVQHQTQNCRCSSGGLGKTIFLY